MLRSALALGIVWILPALVQSQEAKPDLSGVWRRNPRSSSGSQNPPDDLWVRIEQKGATISLVSRARNHGVDETNSEHLRIGANDNANQMHGAPMLSKADWDGDTLLVDSVAKFGGGDLHILARWALSSDRRTLTSVQRRQFGKESPETVTHVFDRQPENAWDGMPATQLAEQSYSNIQILKGIPAEKVPLIMTTFSRVLGVGCAHCHVEGAMEKEDKPAFAKTRQMFLMRNWIADNAKLNVTCWTCHRSHAVPEAGASSNPDLWPAELKMTGEQGSQPAANIFKNLKFFSGRAADLQASMLFMSASLGVDCTHCHVTGAWQSDEKPAKQAARRMLAMVRDERAAFAEIRIGCPTCHHGAVQTETELPAH